MSQPLERVGVFWDYENCAVPSYTDGLTVAHGILRIAHSYGTVTTFRAYAQVSADQRTMSSETESHLISSGVSIVDCPHNGKKDVADVKLMVDMFGFAMDNQPPATIVVISGDRDFLHAVAFLTLRRYRVILIGPANLPVDMKVQAAAVYNWCHDIVPQGTMSITQSFGRGPQAVNVHRKLPSEDSAKLSTPDVMPQSSFSGIASKPATESLDSGWRRPSANPWIKATTATSWSRSKTAQRACDRTSPSPESDSRGWDVDTVSIAAGLDWSASDSPPNELTGEGLGTEDVALHTPPTPSVSSSLLPLSLPTFTFGATTPTEEEDHQTTPQTVATALLPGIVLPTVVMYRTYTTVDSRYRLLVRTLEQQRLTGNTRVDLSPLGSLIAKAESDGGVKGKLYRRAGANGLKDYVLIAEKEGFVITGRDSWDHGELWVALHPKYHGGPRPPPLATTNTL